MSTQQAEVSVTLHTAQVDMSAEQFHFVAFLAANGGGIQLPAGAGGDAIGVQQDKPGQEEGAVPAEGGIPVAVAISGIVKVEAAAGGVALGDKIQALADGTADTAASGDHVVGICVVGAGTGELAEVLLVDHHILA